MTLFNNDIKFDEIKNITIRIRKTKFEKAFSGNNHLEIKTFEKKHKLRLIIRSTKGKNEVKEIIAYLRKKRVPVVIKN
jgi:hypothetical protein